MDTSINMSTINNSSLNRNSSTSQIKKKKKSNEHYLMRRHYMNSNGSNIINKNNINNISDDEDGSNDNINGNTNDINNDKKLESMKKCSSVESLGFIEMELREAYNDPKLIQELNLNMAIPNLTLAVLQTAITTSNGLNNLYHNSINNTNKNKNNKPYPFSNQCQCTIPDPSNLPIINHGKGIMDINDPNGRDNCDDQPVFNEIDELLHDLPDSSDMYKDIEINDDEIGFKDLKKLDQYISGLAKNLKIDDINNNFIVTNDEIISRYSNTNLDNIKSTTKKSSKKEKVLKNVNSKDSLIRLKRIYELKNIEFCKFPGYNATTITGLPNGVSPVEIINNILVNFKMKYQRRWKIYLTSKENLDIICDIFWLTFITWYKNYYRKEYDSMFSRLSFNYVNFIGKLNDTDKNEFLVSYPLILSHINFLIYCECFPNSKNSFENEEFKKRDCDLIYTWFVGNKPFEEVWINWRSAHAKYLISDNDSEYKIKKNKKLNKSKKKEDNYDVMYQVDKSLINNDMDDTFKRPRNKSGINHLSSLYTTDLKTQRIQKNINNNSPIISHYIKNIGYDSSKLPYFVQSYEVTRIPKEYPFTIHIY
ncbi:hypothetical protein BCR32DRAFT_245186 [Anaeromyces robustus]|uniref:Uncharacterized protein n=1 Tax=Anaeromyces robustus TaxID=1754192 RepID=A0A1Y1X6W3_9FUNG|nr:hypothetical protein BCR32DRAFT_245186 [Anaeromyces robustus]|eukprot:ORX81044.1 hypothetical protein BCR32DRAFT_245186 [Anaeromyces robustus]